MSVITQLKRIKIINRITKAYIKDCAKANTEGCPETYDKAIETQKANLQNIENKCGDLCLSRTGEI